MTAFNGAVRTAEEKSRAWRLHTLTWAAENALRLEGDFVECGVFEGFMSQVVVDYLDFAKLPRTFFLYDTFAGFSPRYSSPADFVADWNFYDFAQKAYAKPGLAAEVTARFARYPNVRIIEGVVPDSLVGTAPDRIAYLHVDLNSPKAERAALDALYDRVVPGGYIVFDDYGWEQYGPQMEAADGFATSRGAAVLELPTGQGLLIRS